MELDRFDEFDAYEEVEYKGQETLATSWVLVEKVKAGETIVKARLVVRGDQELILHILSKFFLIVFAFMWWLTWLTIAFCSN